jgi:hypothetical protein
MKASARLRGCASEARRKQPQGPGNHARFPGLSWQFSLPRSAPGSGWTWSSGSRPSAPGATNIRYITRKTASEPDGVDFCIQVAQTGHPNVFCLVANAAGKRE